jgi:hypothetical protein
MRKLSAALLIFFGLASAALAQSPTIPGTQRTVDITGTAGTTRVIPGIAGRSIYITALLLVPVATAVVTISTGTGAACGTNNVPLSGAMTFAAGDPIEYGTGNGAVFVAPVGQDFCIAVGTANAPGSVSFAQF